MYSYEARIRAIELYIKLGKRVRLTIRQLGCPMKNSLKGCTSSRSTCSLATQVENRSSRRRRRLQPLSTTSPMTEHRGHDEGAGC